MMKALFHKTPEDCFDEAILGGNYKYFLAVLLFLSAGIECFVGVMSKEVAIAVAVIMMGCWMMFIMALIIFEADSQYKMKRRIRRAAYFPINKKAFVLSKWKIAVRYGGSYWLVALGVQLLFSPLFGIDNLIAYQGIMLWNLVLSTLLWTLIGTVGRVQPD